MLIYTVNIGSLFMAVNNMVAYNHIDDTVKDWSIRCT